MNDDTNKDESVSESVTTDESDIDENMNLFIYGNVKIRDVVTGEVLVNQRF